MKLICNEMYRNTTRTTDTSGMPRDLTMFLQGVVVLVEYLALEDGWSLWRLEMEWCGLSLHSFIMLGHNFS